MNSDQIQQRAKEFAEIHDGIPKSWDPDYTIPPDRLKKTIQQICEGCQKDFWFAIIENNRPVGLYWLTPKPLSELRALSLWIQPEKRGKGLAKKLKSFAHKEIFKAGHISTITTRVNTKNKTMIHLNRSLGFDSQPQGPWLEMTKRCAVPSK